MYKYISLVPKLRLGNPIQEAPASHDEPGSWSFRNNVPKPELGNEGKGPNASYITAL